MQEENRLRKICIILGCILVFIIALSYLYNFRLILLIAIILTNFLIIILTRSLKINNIIHYYSIIIGWIWGILHLAAIFVVSSILVYLSIILVCGFLMLILTQLISIIEYLSAINLNAELIYKPKMYISLLVTIIILSFFGEKVVAFFFKILMIGDPEKNYILKLALTILKTINFRRRIYELSIILYIVSIIEQLVETSLFNLEIWIYYKSIALEVLLTFIAIDTYIINFLIKKK